MEPVTTKAVRLAQLDALRANGALLNAAKLILVKASFTPSQELAPGDLSEADFNGYAAATALVFNSAYRDADGQYRMDAPSINFQCDEAGTENQIHGWAILNTGGTVVVAAKLLDNPVWIADPDDGLTVIPEIVWGA